MTFEQEPTSEPKVIYRFTKGLDKKLRDVMVYSYDAMAKDYDNLLKKNYLSIADKNYPINTIRLLIAISLFYRIILKPLSEGSDFIQRLSSKYQIGIRIGKKGQGNIDIDEVRKMEKAFYAISKTFGVDPSFFEFQETVVLIQKLTNRANAELEF